MMEFRIIALNDTVLHLVLGSKQVLTRSRGGPATGRCGDTHR